VGDAAASVRRCGVITREALAARLDDPTFVSSQQRAAVVASGNFFLLARPGSGKTRTVGVRLAWTALSTERRVAATSYTNTAIKEIRAMVRDIGVALGPAHFTGTLHDFLLTYVLRPFAVPVLEWARPFRLVGDTYSWDDVVFRGNNHLRLSCGDFHFLADGTLTARGAPLSMTRAEATSEGQATAVRLKRQYAQRGLISLSDAMYYAAQILERSAEARTAVATRFDELIVDEAQDTSDVQVRCLELLKASGGLSSLVLVGDLDQSIYGFQGAAPELCNQLVQTCGLESLPLTENYRSSQAICNVTCQFCGRTEPDRAVGPNRNCDLPVEVFLYPRATPATALEMLTSRLGALGIAQEEVVVLARQRVLVRALNGYAATDLGLGAERLGRLAAAMTAGRTVDRAIVRGVEELLAELAWNVSVGEVTEDQRWQLRLAAMELATRLPAPDGDLGGWLDSARAVTKEVALNVASPLAVQTHHRVRAPRAAGQLSAREAFGLASVGRLVARTVHDVKGESHPAVLLVAGRSTRGQGVRAQAELWATGLSGGEVDDTDREELRIAYVALTRAERYCAVALPDDCSDARLSAFTAAGFRLLGSG